MLMPAKEPQDRHWRVVLRFDVSRTYAIVDLQNRVSDWMTGFMLACMDARTMAAGIAEVYSVEQTHPLAVKAAA